jgi:predicted nucleic-acid-binding protein
MKSLDTNTLLRLLLADIPEQAAVVEELLADMSQKFAVADMVFAELVWVLQGSSYRYDRERIAANIFSILAITHISCNRAMLEKAVPLYVDHPKISFTDACLSVYAELNSAMPLLTFDKKLAIALPKTVSVL